MPVPVAIAHYEDDSARVLIDPRHDRLHPDSLLSNARNRALPVPHMLCRTGLTGAQAVHRPAAGQWRRPNTGRGAEWRRPRFS